MAEPMLVADIGGTNARFAIVEQSSGALTLRNVQSLRVENFATVRAAAEAYLATIAEKPKRACFAAAGPIIDGELDVTNSAWVLRAADIAEPLGFSAFRIVNDFYALAASVAHLPADAFVTVRSGTAVDGAPQLVVGPGTGLGQALIVPTDFGPRIVSTEGGHVSFAPQTDEEAEVTSVIARDHQRVSVERLLSGPGLVNIYSALCEVLGARQQPLLARDITAAAKKGECSVAVKTVDMFFAALGSVVGDAVLATGARGGVVLTGGVLPKVKELFLSSAFCQRFLDKGRMRDYVDDVPVRLIVTDGAGLYGAAAAMENDK